MLSLGPTLHHRDDVIHITVNTGEALPRVGEGGGSRLVTGILEMVPFSGTVSVVLTREFGTFISILDNTKKNLGESTHYIDNARSIQMMMPTYSGNNGMTYAKAPT